MRSQGQVRFIKVSSRLQMIAAGVAVGALAFWAISMGAMAIAQYGAQSDRLALLEREAKVASSESRFSEYGADLKAVASDLKRRQDVLEEMSAAIPDDVTSDGTVSDSSSEAAKTVSKVSASFPEAASLVRIEARQLAYVERLTRFADSRSARAERAIRKLGLDPKSMMASAGREAMGGPLLKLATNSDGSLDPRFERLGLSLARMQALELSLDGIPQFRPANVAALSSSFGYRRDPITGGGAMHSGMDFKGPLGSPIYSAAVGTISFAGYKGGYGKVIEIDHGNGLMTRYAHLSRFSARVGDAVNAGSLIGAMGSTGRSTGSHLHFEVRINNRAVNPRPFMESAPDVLKEARNGNARKARTDG
ncbi:M23 family metallopeptidase [Altererythrobacter sp. ZODW24]|uniref:M23 family metallopeptidase n=1 Tax=Altererythrobacter sp. ZODW24 TaxID=2185142 RepID=UPI000DF862F8|nr:M23 family metallopeptidase [Altererythrobacter sp. ZODW24]